MAVALTRQRISEAVDRLGRRLILGVAVTHVAVPSLAAAADAASIAVSAVGAEGDGHPSADLHADRVVLRLHTTTEGSVTEHDIGLAHRLTRRSPHGRCAPNPATGPWRRRPSRSPSTHSTSRSSGRSGRP